MTIKGAPVAFTAEPLKPVSSLDFTCKCGCDLFRVDIEVYADYSWTPALKCVGCGSWCCPTQPLLNGPH